MERKAGKWKKIFSSMVKYIAGGFLYALGLYFFAKSADFAPGGISGLAMMGNHLFHLPIGFSTLVLNIPLMLVSFRIVGKKFLLKSFISIGICTIFLDLVFPFFPVYTGEPILAVLYAGICVGIGLAIFYMNGASSGGTDFLTVSIKVKKPHLSIGIVTMCIDFVIISLGWLVFGNMDAVLYGLLYTFTVSIIIDKIMYGAGAGKLVIIISGKGSDIAGEIGGNFKRGSTMIHALGTYSGEEREVLLCACSKAQAYKVRQLVQMTDSAAFVMIMDTSEVYGKGFKALDAKGEILG